MKTLLLTVIVLLLIPKSQTGFESDLINPRIIITNAEVNFSPLSFVLPLHLIRFYAPTHCLRAYQHSWETFRTWKYFRYLMFRKHVSLMFRIIGLCGVLVITKASCLLCKHRKPSYFSNFISVNISRLFQWIYVRRWYFFPMKNLKLTSAVLPDPSGPLAPADNTSEKANIHVSVTSLTSGSADN